MTARLYANGPLDRRVGRMDVEDAATRRTEDA
jgi:hypothetical protein